MLVVRGGREGSERVEFVEGAWVYICIDTMALSMGSLSLTPNTLYDTSRVKKEAPTINS
jgi:hypothetical protein